MNEGTLKLFGGNVFLKGDYISDGTLEADNGTIELNGSGNQLIPGKEVGKYYNLTIDKSSGVVNHTETIIIKGTLDLTDGFLNSTNGNIVVLTKNASVINTSDSSFVSGPVKKVGKQAFSFPIGKSNRYMPLTISAPLDKQDAYIATFFDNEQNLGTKLDTLLGSVSSCEYWKLKRTKGNSDVFVTLNWDENSCDIDYLPALRVSRWNGSQWVSLGNGGTTGDLNKGAVTSSIKTDEFGSFAISSSIIVGPNRYWIADQDSNWSNPNNWSVISGGPGGASVPNSNNTAIFDYNGVGGCNIDQDIHVEGLNIKSGYVDTVVQGENIISIDNNLLTDGGTFFGGDTTIEVLGNYVISGGLFISTENVLEVHGDFTSNGGIFNPNSGIVRFVRKNIISGSQQFDNLEFNPTVNSKFEISSGTILTVNNNLLLSGSNKLKLNTGQIDIKGNIVVRNTFSGGKGTALLNLNGIAQQFFVGNDTIGQYQFPNVQISKNAGTLFLSGIINLGKGKDWTYLQGMITSNLASSRIVFLGKNKISGSHTLGNVEFLNNDTLTTYEIDSASSLIISNDLILNGVASLRFKNGTIEARGDVINSNTGLNGGGSTEFLINGLGPQQLIGTNILEAGKLPNLTINKIAGLLTLNNTINLAGNWIYQRGNIDAITNNSTVAFYKNRIITSRSFAGAMNFDNIIIAAKVKLGSDLVLDGSLVIDSASQLNINAENYTIEIKGDWTNNGIFKSRQGLVIFNGLNDQSITNPIGETFYKLKINSEGVADVILNDSVTVKNNLSLLSGFIRNDTNSLLILNQNAAVSDVSNQSYVHGPVKKIGKTDFTFPIGNSMHYRPLAISAPQNKKDAYVAQYFNFPQAFGSNSDTVLSYISTCEYWTLDRANGISKVKVKLSWDENSCGIDENLNSLRIAGWNGTKWINHGSGEVLGERTFGTIESIEMLDTFIAFAIASEVGKIERYWIANSIGNWNDSTNWSIRSGGPGGASVPSIFDKAIFDGNGLGDCNIDTEIDIVGLTIGGAYSGIINQNSNNITIGDLASLSGGTFLGNNGNIVVNGNLIINGNDFQSTLDTLTLLGNVRFNLGTFNHNNGTVKFARTDTLEGDFAFYNLIYDAEGNNAIFEITENGQITVENDITLSGSESIFINTGTINLGGDVFVLNTSPQGGGTANLVFNGVGTQMVNGSYLIGAGALPKILINKAETDSLICLRNIVIDNNLNYISGLALTTNSTIIFNGTNLNPQGVNSSIRFDSLIIGDSAVLMGALVSNNLSITVNGKLDAQNSSIQLQGTWNNKGQFVAGTGTVTFNGDDIQQINNITQEAFYNLVIEKPSGNILSSTSILVAKDLVLNAGILELGMNKDLILDFTGNIIGGNDTSYVLLNGLGMLRKMYNNISSLPFNFALGDNNNYTPLILTLNNGDLVSGSYISARVFNSLEPNLINPTNYINRYWQLSSNITNNIDYNISASYKQGDVVGNENLFFTTKWDNVNGFLVFNLANALTNNLSVSGVSSFGNFTGVEDKNVSITSWVGVTSTSWTEAANWTNGIPKVNSVAIIGDNAFTGSFNPQLNNAVTIRSLELGNGFNPISLSTFNNDLTVLEDIVIGSQGILKAFDNTISIGADFVNSGVYEPGVNTTIFNGFNNQLIGQGNFYNLIIKPQSNDTCVLTGSIVVNHDLLIDNGNLFASNFNINIGSRWDGRNGNFIPGTSTVTFTGLTADDSASISGTTYFNLVIDMPISSTVFMGTPTTSVNIQNSLTVSSGTFSQTRPVNVITSTQPNNALIVEPNGIIEVMGTSFTQSYSDFNVTLANGSTVEYAGSSPQEIDPNLAYSNLQISGSAAKSLGGDVTVANNFTNVGGNGDMLNFTNNNFDLSVEGAFDIGSGQVNINAGNLAIGMAYFSSCCAIISPNNDGTVIFNGSIGATFNSTGEAIPNLIVATVAGLTLNGPIDISNSLSINAGMILNDNAPLTFENNATFNSTVATSFISGPVSKEGNSTFDFPVGKGGLFAPLIISPPFEASDAFTVEFFNEPQPFGSEKDPSLATLSQCGYWKVDRTVGSSEVFVTLGWQSAICGISNLDDLRVAAWDGNKWIDLGNGEITGTLDSGSIRSFEPVPFYSYFIIASNSFDNLSAQAFINNNSATLAVKNNTYLNMDGDITFSGNNGTVNNDGQIKLNGIWRNNSSNEIFTDSIGTVELFGPNQLITGNTSTKFSNLVLSGEGVKKLNVNTEVAGVLSLNANELATDSNLLFILNSNTNAISRTTGFVSSEGLGGLVREMKDTLDYLFPVGSSKNITKYRPVKLKPSTVDTQVFVVSLANNDATEDGFDISRKDTSLSNINHKFYHKIRRLSGAETIDITVFFDDTRDGVASRLVHWQNEPQWEAATNSSLNIATAPGQLSSITITDWNDFSFVAFALSGQFGDFSGIYTVGGSEADYFDITSAINAINGRTLVDTVVFVINDGVYYESIDLGDSISYMTNNLAIPITFTTNDIVTNNVTFTSASEVLNIKNKANLLFAGINFSSSLDSGVTVLIEHSDSVTFFNCDIKNTLLGETALLMKGTSNFTFSGSSISDFSKGLVMTDSSNGLNILSNNIIVEDSAIQGRNISDITISGNVIKSEDINSNVSLNLEQTEGFLLIAGNELFGNGNTIQLDQASSSTLIRDNILQNSNGNSIFIKSFSDSLFIDGNSFVSSNSNLIKIKDFSPESDILDAVPNKFMFISNNVSDSDVNIALNVQSLVNTNLVILNNSFKQNQIGLNIKNTLSNMGTSIKVVGNMFEGIRSAILLDSVMANTALHSNTIVARNNASNSAIELQKGSDNILFCANNAVNLDGTDVVFFDNYTPTNITTAWNNWYSFNSSQVSNNEGLIFSANDVKQQPQFVDVLTADYRLASQSPLLDKPVDCKDSLVFADLNGEPRGDLLDIGAYETPSTQFDSLQIELVLDHGMAISPNGDGNFDEFVINGLNTFNTVDVKIFDRLNNLVFQTNNTNEFWDGVDFNTQVPVLEDSYRYLLTLDFRTVSGIIYVER